MAEERVVAAVLIALALGVAVGVVAGETAGGTDDGGENLSLADFHNGDDGAKTTAVGAAGFDVAWRVARDPSGGIACGSGSWPDSFKLLGVAASDFDRLLRVAEFAPGGCRMRLTSQEAMLSDAKANRPFRAALKSLLLGVCSHRRGEWHRGRGQIEAGLAGISAELETCAAGDDARHSPSTALRLLGLSSISNASADAARAVLADHAGPSLHLLPGLAPFYFFLASTNREIYNGHDAAVDASLMAAEGDPTCPRYTYLVGSCFLHRAEVTRFRYFSGRTGADEARSRDDIGAAIRELAKALAMAETARDAKTFRMALLSLVHTKDYYSDLDGLEALRERGRALTRAELDADTGVTIASHMAILLCDEMLLRGVNARQSLEWAATLDAQLQAELAKRRRPLDPTRGSPGNRMNLAVVHSAGVTGVMGALIDCIFRAIDRTRFHVTLFDPDESQLPGIDANELGVDDLVWIGQMGSDQAAAVVSAYAPDILIDAYGVKKRHSFETVLYQTAPLTIEWLGWPTTTGSPVVDYVMVDHAIVGGAQAPHASQFSERVLVLPDMFTSCYPQHYGRPPRRNPSDGSATPGTKPKRLDLTTYPVGDVGVHNDSQARAVERDQSPLPKTTRDSLGLPSNKFVFATFNQAYKMSPELVDDMSAILRGAPNSVLWLLRHPTQAESYIRQAFAARGIASDRVVFTDATNRTEYLERAVLADLFLDAYDYAAGATAVDMMWAGVPVLTKPSSKMVTRLATSVVTTAGFAAEMVVDTREEYVSRAVSYATSGRGDLAGVRARLEASVTRRENRLFRPLDWVRVFEAALLQVWRGAAAAEADANQAPVGSGEREGLSGQPAKPPRGRLTVEL